MKYTFSENIQRGLLFLLKQDKNFFSQITPLVKPEYFEYTTHSNIYRAVVGYFEKYRDIPVDDFILEECKALKESKELMSSYEDELEYINGSLDPSAISNTDFFLDKIEEFAKKAAMKEAITNSIGLIQNDEFDAVEEEVRKALTVSRNLDLGQDYFEDVQARWLRSLEKDGARKFGVLLPTLNRELEGGLGSKEIAMVVAPPGVGKSLFLVNQGVISLMEGRNVLYVSLEMSEDKIAQRFDSVMTLISQRTLPTQQDNLQNRLSVFKKEFPTGSLRIKEYPTGLAKISNLRSYLSQLKNHEGWTPDVLIVDYLELLLPSREAPEYLAQEMLARELRGLAVEQDLLVWTATQTNRQGRNVSIITDAELGDSYGKFRTMDYALSLNQNEQEFDEGRMRCYVMKSRNGRTRFTLPMNIDYSTLRMTEGVATHDEFEE